MKVNLFPYRYMLAWFLTQRRNFFLPAVCVLFFLGLVPENILAQKLGNVRLTAETRYDNLNWGTDRNRLEGAIRLWVPVDFGRGFMTVAHLSTGDDYKSRWSTLTEFDGERQHNALLPSLRQIYLQYRSDSWQFQAGAIPTILKEASRTGLEPNGWIDGARLVRYFHDGTSLELVRGSITSTQTPHVFNRSMDWNFWEVELVKPFSDQLSLEASFEHYLKNNYVRSELVWAFEGAYPTLTPELMLNVTNRRIFLGLGLGFSKSQIQEIVGVAGLQVDFLYLYTQPDFGQRGLLADDYYSDHHAFYLELEGAMWKDAPVQWFFRQILTTFDRTSAGIRLNLEK